jgi:hypothetical protein
MLSSPIQSDLLLERDRTSGKVRYTLRPEALKAFGALGILVPTIIEARHVRLTCYSAKDGQCEAPARVSRFNDSGY